YIRRERAVGQFARTFFVGDGVTEADVKAKYENGILQLSIPKKEAKKVDTKKYIAIEG
ncbi:Hsp20/alpha crystallin family protein, partial [Acidaminococcus timonensis]|uniref:Hsp20/alpha crystallin family protein n=1 Tax=Acidaminococcus timonensis TaxID=1871002 RepID=UPI00350E3435